MVSTKAKADEAEGQKDAMEDHLLTLKVITWTHSELFYY